MHFHMKNEHFEVDMTTSTQRSHIYSSMKIYTSNEKQWDYDSVVSKSLLKDEVKVISPTNKEKTADILVRY